MCEKCVEIDRKIAHYRTLPRGYWDQATIDGLQQLIAELVPPSTTVMAFFQNSRNWQRPFGDEELEQRGFVLVGAESDENFTQRAIALSSSVSRA